jgi:two-component system, OmpR family, response regulator RstA
VEIRTFVNGAVEPEIFRDKKIFIDNGFDISTTEGLENLSALPANLEPAIIIIACDFNLTDDTNLCREIRKSSEASILVISSDNSPEYESALLEAGADDVLAKPLMDKVLLAHLKALIRRRTNSNGDNNHNGEKTINTDEWSLDELKRTARINNKNIRFSSVEFALFNYLAQNINQVVSRDQLFNTLMKMDYNGLDRRIDIQISRLRKRLATHGIDPEMIKTVRNEGYIFIYNSEP